MQNSHTIRKCLFLSDVIFGFVLLRTVDRLAKPLFSLYMRETFVTVIKSVVIKVFLNI